MKFSRLAVVRVGKHVTVRAVADWDKVSGRTLEFNLEAESMVVAELYETFFQRLILAANAFEDTSDDVLQATLNLSKGRQDEHD